MAEHLTIASNEEFLPPVRRWQRAAGTVLLSSLGAAVALMTLWPYRVVVRGGGQVRPSGETSLIQAPFAARVRRVAVQANQRVRAGELIALLDPTDLEGSREVLRQSGTSLALQLSAQQRQSQASLAAGDLEVRKAEASLQLATAEMARYRQLAAMGAGSRQQLDEKTANHSLAVSDLAKARQAVQELRSRQAAEQARLVQQLHSNSVEQRRSERDLRNTAVRAPVSGVIFSLQLRNPQQVVRAGEELARLAPSSAGLVVKVLVPSTDISPVQPGQQADLRVAGCPYPDHGTLAARVISIAPEAIQGSYEVTLQPMRSWLGQGQRRCSLRLGMDVSAAIITRHDTVLRFVLRKARLISQA